MAAAQEFYNYAHFGWAETAKTERERAILLRMAAAWLEVAQHWEAAKGVGEASRHRTKVVIGLADAGARAVARVGSIAATF